MRITGLAIFTTLILGLAARDGFAAPRAERFAPRVTLGDRTGGDRTVHLNGVGLCEWGFFAIDLYYCALYLERKTKDPKVVIASKQAKRIHLRFVRSLTRAQLQKAYTVSVEVNAGKELPRYRSRLKQLTAAMDDRCEDSVRWLGRLYTELPHKRRMIAEELRERSDFVDRLVRDPEVHARLIDECPAWFPRTEIC